MYFERKKYKNFALRQLKGRWVVPVLVTLFAVLIIKLFTIPNEILCYRSGVYSSFDFTNFFNSLTELAEARNAAESRIFRILNEMIEFIMIFASLNMYLSMTRGPEEVKFSDFIAGIGNWFRAFLCYWYRGIFIFLWTLCFIIPGFIKALAYSQMPYFLTEFADISVPDSMELSKTLTDGHKWDIFVMKLSFLGWDLLGILTGGIAFLWITPYKRLTYFNAFHAMLKDAVDSGKIKMEELI